MGAILIMTGMGLALLSWGAVLVLASFIVYGYRIHVEEKALVVRFGEGYGVCIRETKMAVPFIL
jgi:protein-S-isoprenylcysteine O-methyltransferase Ste14